MLVSSLRDGSGLRWAVRSKAVVLKLFGVITPRQCYDRSSLPPYPIPLQLCEIKGKNIGMLSFSAFYL